MPIAKIEPTGCTVRKGKVQLRFSFYLEPGDARYEEQHVQVPIIPEGGYPGEVDAEGTPLDQEHYNSWLESLPKQGQDNPFHNHLVYVDADTPDAEIKQLLTETLEEFYGIWAEGADINKEWKVRPLKARQHFNKSRAGFDREASKSKVKQCENRVKTIKERVAEFEVVRNGSN